MIVLVSGSFRPWCSTLLLKVKNSGKRHLDLPNMPAEIRFHDDCAAVAMAWVFKASSCALPHYNEAIDHAKASGIAIGLHMESRHILVCFAKGESKDSAEKKLKVIFSKGGASEIHFETVEVLDLFHAESWGIVSLGGPPPMPKYADNLIEASDSSDAEESAEEILGKQVVAAFVSAGQNAADIFAMVPTTTPEPIQVPTRLEALEMGTFLERQIRKTMEDMGGAISPWLKERIFRPDQQHVHDVQNEFRALAVQHPGDPFMWITGAPPCFLDVYFKPNMHVARRVEWIQWKAAKLGLQLDLPLFMAFFKQITNYKDEKNRLSMYKMAVQTWQRKPLNWKALDENLRNLIRNINVGDLNCFCKHCKRVLPVSSGSSGSSDSGGRSDGFCSKYCSLQFCDCGLQYKVRQVVDHVEWEQQQNRVGHYRTLVELVNMLPLKSEVDRYKTLPDLNDEYAKLADVRRFEGCCKAVEGLPDGYFEKVDGKMIKKALPCVRCKARWMHLTAVQSALGKISTGMVTWGHCEAAAKIMEEMKSMPVPKMDEKFCESCEPAHKKVRKV